MPDENDIVFKTFSFKNDTFKVLYESLFGSGMTLDSVTLFLLQLWTIYSVFAFLLSGLFIIGIIYAYIKIAEYAEAESHHLHESEHRWHELYGGHAENNRWGTVQKHIESENPNDWKLAIIEADVLLERMLDKAGFVGATIGEKLKNTSGRSFETIDDAWQAHRVRNQIAHGGADYVLTHKVAKETLIQYERVFKEFDAHGAGEHNSHGGGHH
jgi:hypothetical protein